MEQIRIKASVVKLITVIFVLLVYSFFPSPLISQIEFNKELNKQFFSDTVNIYDYLQKNGHPDDVIISSRDSNGWGLIHYAVYYENTEFLKKLIQLGADINIRNNEGATPLMLSIFITNTPLAKELVKIGADVNIKDNNDNTPFALAKLRGYKNLCELLISKGADGIFEYSFTPRLVMETNTNFETEMAAISPDNKLLASLGKDALILMNIETGKLINKFNFHISTIKKIEFSNDGMFLILWGYDFVTILDIKTLKPIRTIEFFYEVPDLSNDSNHLFQFFSFYKIYSNRFYNKINNTIIEVIKPFKDSILYLKEYSIKHGKVIRETSFNFDISSDFEITCSDFDEAHNLFMLGYSDGTLKKYLFEENAKEQVLAQNYKFIKYINISGENNFAYIIDITNNLKKIDIETGEEIFTINEAFSSDDSQFLITDTEIINVCCNGFKLNHFSTSNGTLVGNTDLHNQFPDFQIFQSKDFRLIGIIQPNFNKLTFYHKCSIYDRDKDNLIFETTDIVNEVFESKLSGLGYLHFVCNGRINNINVNLPGEIISENLQNEYNYYWDQNTDYYINVKRYIENDRYGDSIIIKNFNDKYFSYNIKLERGNEAYRLTSDSKYLFKFSGDGKMLAIHYNENILIVNLLKKEIKGNIETGFNFILSFSFSEDSKYFLFASFSKLMYYDINSEKIVDSLEFAKDTYTESQISPNGRYLVTSNQVNGVLLWDLKLKKRIFEIFKSFSPLKYGNLIFNKQETFFLYHDLDDIKKFDIQTKQWEYVNYNAGFSELNGLNSSFYSSFFENLPVNVISIDDNNKFVFVTKGSFIKIMDFVTGKELCRIYAIDSNDWAASTPEGYFDGTKRGIEKLHWTAGGEILSLTQIPNFYYPGLLKTILTENEEIKNTNYKIPNLKLPPEINTIFEPGEDVLKINAVNKGGGIGKMMLYIDGKEIDSNIAFGKYSTNADTINLNIDLKNYNFLVPGRKHDIEVRAVNNDSENIINSRQVLIDGIQVEGDSVSNKYEPRIFILSVGINEYSDASLRLNYCENDASDFLKAIKLSAIGLLRHFNIDTSRVIPMLLSTDKNNSSAEPTKENINEKLQYVKDNAKYDDIIIYYFAGHGINKNGQFYYLTKEASKQNVATEKTLEQYTVSGNEILNSLKNPCKKQIIILDVCNSGAIGSNEGRTIREQINAFQEMKNRGGQYILAGCQENDISYETENLGHGILTYSLLASLRSGDGLKILDETDNCKCYVDIYSLLFSTAEKTILYAKQNNKEQIPVIKIPGSSTGFIIGRLDKNDLEFFPELKSMTQQVFVESIRKDNAKDKEFFDYIKNSIVINQSKNKNTCAYQYNDKNSADAVKIFINYESSKEHFIIEFSKTDESCKDKIITAALNYSEKEKLSEVLLKELTEYINNCNKKTK